jgi:hypothetical protein
MTQEDCLWTFFFSSNYSQLYCATIVPFHVVFDFLFQLSHSRRAKEEKLNQLILHQGF